ncbi:hypothetical protein O9929_18635 [Vibrio lentus]|nr:hypothetical protein [Vibrio lentus]
MIRARTAPPPLRVSVGATLYHINTAVAKVMARQFRMKTPPKRLSNRQGVRYLIDHRVSLKITTKMDSVDANAPDAELIMEPSNARSPHC